MPIYVTKFYKTINIFQNSFYWISVFYRESNCVRVYSVHTQDTVVGTMQAGCANHKIVWLCISKEHLYPLKIGTPTVLLFTTCIDDNINGNNIAHL